MSKTFTTTSDVNLEPSSDYDSDRKKDDLSEQAHYQGYSVVDDEQNRSLRKRVRVEVVTYRLY